MNIDFKDEYATLRQEMLDRFGRIHDTVKYGIGAFILFLSYYYGKDEFDNFIALAILQLFVTLIGVYSLRLYQSIYTIGTYIAIIMEKASGVRWHRMSRNIDKYKIMERDGNKGGTTKTSKRWLSDSSSFAVLLVALMFIGFCAVFLKAQIRLSELRELCIPQLVRCIIIVVITFFNFWILCMLTFRMTPFREKCEETWKKYSRDFGTDKFPDPYADH